MKAVTYYFLGQIDGERFELYIYFYFLKTTYLSIKQKKIKPKKRNHFSALTDDRTQFVIRALQLF